MRYILQTSDDNGKSWENTTIRKKTKAEIEQWIQDNINATGLDWRVGFVVRFRRYPDLIYRWVKLSDYSEVKP